MATPKRKTAAKCSSSARFTPADKARKAKPPGKRKSKSGKTYFENRVNRSDASPRKRI